MRVLASMTMRKDVTLAAGVVLPALFLVGSAAAQEGAPAKDAPRFEAPLPAGDRILEPVRLPPVGPAAGFTAAGLNGEVPFSGPTPVADLVTYARTVNPRIHAARAAARALSERVPQEESLPDPMLMTDVFLGEFPVHGGSPTMMGVRQMFPWFGKRGLRGTVAQQEALAAYARLTATELEVIEELKRAYFDLYFVQAASGEVQRLEPVLEDIVEIARTRYETALEGAGLESVLQAQVELLQLRTTLAELEQSQVRARARLAAATSLPPPLRIEALERDLREEQVASLEVLVQFAESQQPEWEERRREIARDQAAVALAQRDYYPDVTMSFTWDGMFEPMMREMAPGHNAFMLGMEVNLPIYRRRLDAAVREATCRLVESRHRYAASRDAVEAELHSLYAEFEEHRRVLDILDEILPRADETLELSVEAYRVGQIGFQQLIENYRTLLDFRIERHQRLAQREQALATLERTVGAVLLGE